MATARKDFRGRVLRKGEVQRASDKRYMYCYTDPFGRRKYIYANDLVTLREKEMRLTKNQLDGLDTYVAGYATVNFVFDRYISLKTNLRETTRSNYLYMYDRHVHETFGERKIADIKYSDVLQFYNYLVVMKGLQTNTLESIHCLLHPTFQLAFRDDIIRKKSNRWRTGRGKENLWANYWNSPRIDDSPAAGVYGAHCQPSNLLSLVADVHDTVGYRLPYW